MSFTSRTFQEYSDFVDRITPESLPLTRKIFKHYMNTMANKTGLAVVLDNARDMFSPITEKYNPLIEYDSRIQNFKTYLYRDIIVSSIQNQSQAYYYYFYRRFFEDVKITLVAGNMVARTIKTTDEFPEKITDDNYQTDSFVDTVALMVEIPFNKDTQEQVQAVLNQEFRILVSIVKPARLFFFHLPSLSLIFRDGIADYGTTEVDLFAGKDWQDVSSFIRNQLLIIYDKTTGETDLEATALVSVELRDDNYYRVTWAFLAVNVSRFAITDLPGGVKNFQFLFNRSYQVNGDTLNSEMQFYFAYDFLSNTPLFVPETDANPLLETDTGLNTDVNKVM